MTIYYLAGSSDNHSKTGGRLYQFCGDERKNHIIHSESLKFKSKLLDNTHNAGITNEKIVLPLKY